MRQTDTHASVLVWDLPLRLFHWALLVLVVFSVVTGKFGADLGPGIAPWHRVSGYAILALLIFRLLWGFVGGTHSRFADFVRGPRVVGAYLRSLAGRSAGETHRGHNPLAGWWIVAMLACLAVQAATGLFIRDDDLGFEGPLNKYVSGAIADKLSALHEFNFFVLAGLVVAHVAALGYHRIVKGENLVGPFVTGRKPVCADTSHSPPSGGRTVWGAVVLAIGAAVVWLITNLS